MTVRSTYAGEATRVACLMAMLALPLAACEALPDVQFVEDGGAVSASDGDVAVTSDAGERAHDAASPVKVVDAGGSNSSSSSSSSSSSGGTADTCPTQVPTGATLCCGSAPCVGQKCASRCAECGVCGTRTCCVSNGLGMAVTCETDASACGP